MKKKFKTPKFLEDAIKRCTELEQKEWKEFTETHTESDIFWAEMYKDLIEVQHKLFFIKVKYGLNLEFNIKH